MTDKKIEEIVKPIFTKMYNSNFSACEYGIECYKKGMEYQGIKELEKENEQLCAAYNKQKEINKELVDDIAALQRDKADLIFVRDQKAKHINELKDQLTKAKEVIRQFLNDYPVITKAVLDKLEQLKKDLEK